MKKISKILFIVIIAVFILMLMSITAFAQSFDFNTIASDLDVFDYDIPVLPMILGVFSMLFSPVTIILVLGFYTVISSIIKTSALKQIIAELEVTPSQANAEKLLNALKKLNVIHRTLFKMGGQGAIEKKVWEVLFTRYIATSNIIKDETKLEIRTQLTKIGVYNLNNTTVSAYDAQERGALGEENVWFTLSLLPNSEKCNVFRNLFVSDANGKNEIDGAIISSKGIFLIETKSVTHKATSPDDISNIVVYGDINDPYEQIQMHEDTFTRCLNVSKDIVKNLLVMSYPHKERVNIDISTFPTNKNFIPLKVDSLMEFIKTYDGPDVLDDETIIKISQELTKCVYVTREGVKKTEWKFCNTLTPHKANSVTKVESPNTKVKFCPQCGNENLLNTPFCPNCGTKLG